MTPQQVTAMDWGESVQMDRTRLYALEAAEQRHQEQQALDHVAHYQALGVGLVAMCEVMFDTMMASEKFTREEVMGILRAAVQGR